MWLTELVRNYHSQHSVRPNRYSPLVVRTLKGSMRRFSGPVHQKSPLTRDDLKLVNDHLPRPLSHDNLLFLTMLCVDFFGLLRLGELVRPDTSSLRSTSKISWRHDVHFHSTFFSFSIPQSKTDVIFEGDQVVIQKSTTYLVSCDSHFALFPQLWLLSDGSVPSCSWFLSRYIMSFLAPLGVIPRVLVAQHPWPMC